MNLNTFQSEQAKWSFDNFGNQPKHRELLGLIEEVGELSHSHLKMEQGIRGTLEEHKRDAKDAIGDILIYLAGYCNNNGYNLQEILNQIWEDVKQRNWKKNSKTGL